MVEWVTVKTSRINRIGYSREVNTMFIDFQGSEIDTPYVNVPENIFKSFAASDTINKFFNEHIDGKFKVEHVGS
ncbi:KTSC domain-containing protein [Cocleimonas sp. KMM 6892]|uniref:KTSC domain-containing protein n=1 Tax=unclassified Cocleimonas TaxID=2639732 RepID=UPI002DB9AB25|nr:MULTISPECIES: KTSC domain-containing protein [unclassified Cocleimonas]MEB8431895.1 KTSC domain-containing protein [Cocleimonas sp. KMM 6892]MEC4715019.1 KTSC domain-containing protein [Cocleimonas sp. KMM 6895]MEC4744167.1 KTSC domain-containing protein [Cocleimonas sp. KMM 6896]